MRLRRMMSSLKRRGSLRSDSGIMMHGNLQQERLLDMQESLKQDVVFFRSIDEFVKTRKHVEHGHRRQAFFSNGFNLQYQLGGGAFGQVFLAEEISSGFLKAIKGIDLKKVSGQGDEFTWLTLEERAQAHDDALVVMQQINRLPDGVVKHHFRDAHEKLQGKLKKEEDPQQRKFRRPVTEHEILKRLSFHPFVSKLEASFRDENKLYLVFHHYPCGTFKDLLASQGNKLSEEHAKFYAAEMVLGLQFLQSNNIAHRDFKPDNILLDREGHIAISDFGLATRLRGGLKTLCGTAEYIAPEVLSHKTWKSSYLDWWAFGITLYEILVGTTPFGAPTAQVVFMNILTAPLQFPAHVSPTARDLISRLLSRNIDKRIHPNEIIQHPFFEGIDKQMLFRKLIEPPIKPPAKELRLKHEITPAMRRRPRIEYSFQET